MKSFIYTIIAFTFFVVSFFYCFHEWIDFKIFRAERCAHIDRIEAVIDGQATWNGKNNIGEDKSCYVEFELNGRKRKGEWWNVGNCDEGRVIEIDVVDYSCH